MLDLRRHEYRGLFVDLIERYLASLIETGVFTEIGHGVRLFQEHPVTNIAAEVGSFESNLGALRQFELVTVNNPIVRFAEEHGYFECLNKNTLAWDELVELR